MQEASKTQHLPEIPTKRYFAIGEVAELCGVKPHVLRYWEQEFPQLKPVKRRGNRRYYQQHDVLMVRQIRELLYDRGFTINGARQQLSSKVAVKESVVPVEPSGVNAQDKRLTAQLLTELEDVLNLLESSPEV
ncbi:MAG: MerR family transcriptional regulator [Gammaproteobacteria bacterium]|nr:MerR family transcriptional regulator [Gammaproteobacteria bacterium]